MMVAADLMRRGYKIALPYGEDWDFDLIVCRDGSKLERVQVKYSRSRRRRDPRQVLLSIRSRTARCGRTKYYTAETDRLARGLRPD